jgi:DNA-binding PadR family transcriptional regulator
MTINKEALRRMIVRIVLEREISGYGVYKELQTKGVQLRPNYLYMILAEMRSKGLLKARWVDDGKGPRKHMFSLSDAGQEEFRQQVRDSLNVIADAFNRANMNTRDLSDHIAVYKGSFARFGIPFPSEGDKIVYTSPSFSPLACYPVNIRFLSELYPDSSIFVVKPAGVKFVVDKPNVTFLEGRRHDMPLKDGFADYLTLEGFPKAVSEEKTIAECARVLSDRGHLMVRVPGVLVEEFRPRFSNFAEFALGQYYDNYGQDRIVSAKRVKSLLGERFGELIEYEAKGNLVFLAGEKRNVRVSSALPETPEQVKLPAR